ncbi:hypothetical protein SKAU_G00247420 [Synaphobranchus kaupii]|uniref:PiggyBac transposable element-derived protein domain-containing protein n=1 Tax=Synaphobranchus kaupii TaxID=118154 RepID=A0A9Q1IRJ9_SYNKA|nr:hypothetical protein SKAU_G00247420 [Synaphobranchus kaupii]
MDVDADDYSCLLQSLKRRRALTSDELRVIAEHDMDDHQGMHCVEEDALDAELLQAQVQTEELEEEEEDDEMDCDLEPRRASEGRPLGLDLGSVRRAVRLTTSVMLREIDFFMLFFTQAIVADICGFTNWQGWELVLNRASYAGVEGVWNEVTPDEFYRFMGLLIYMGFHVLPDMHRYWGTKSLQGSWARSFMSRDRFKALLAARHVVDPATEDNQDRLKKLRYLMDHLKQKCQELFQPNQNLAIDERMVKSKGRSGLKQFMKGKPTRWGFKFWVIATSDSGYTLDFNVYTGSRDGRVTDLATKVVEALIQPYKDQGYNLWMDNFYTSPALMVTLRQIGINACGTCRINRKKFPEEFKDVKTWERKTDRGDMRWCRVEDGILVIQWKDTRAVTCLSNFHNANDSTNVTRLVKKDATWSSLVVRQPAVISDYNKHMGGVDRSDQMISSYNVLQKTQKWWKTLFFHFIDIAVVNSFLLFQEWQHSQAGDKHRLADYSHITFRENLSRQLAGLDIHASSPSHSLKPVASSFHVTHTPELQKSANNCWLCYRKSRIQRKTKFACMAPECNGKRFCIVQSRNCFRAWHSAECDQFRAEA